MRRLSDDLYQLFHIGCEPNQVGHAPSPLIALQIEYSLINRDAERDLIPMARAMGLGVTPYSPLGGGVLSGKYSRADLTVTSADSGDSNRKSFNAGLGMVTEHTLAIADVVREVATQVGHTPAQVALAWTLRNPGVTAPVIGARTPEQLVGNLGALEVDFTADQLARLDEVSAIDLGYPHDLLASDHIRTVTAGNLQIETRCTPMPGSR
jgi:aryl-alcohol dehydrogenase-like predicted oxidoreductase